MPYILSGAAIVALGMLITFWPSLHATRFGQEIEHVGGIFASLLGPFISALIGAIVRRMHNAGQPGAKRMTFREWIFEGMSVLLCGIMGGGVSAWMQAPEYASWAIAGCAGYIGPVVVQMLFNDFRTKFTGNPIPPPDLGKGE